MTCLPFSIMTADDVKPPGADRPEASSSGSDSGSEWRAGDRVRVIAMPAYVKTAETRPMLRPPNVIRVGEVGTVVDRRQGAYWSVRFEKGLFLMEQSYLERVSDEA